MSNQPPAPQPQYEIPGPPTDGITAVKIIESRFLLVSSWDTSVRIYDIHSKEQVTMYNHKAGVLDCCFWDKYHTFSGGIDKTVKSFDINTTSEKVIGLHDKAVRCVDFNSTLNTLITGSWDTTIKLWDSRSDNACTGIYKQPDKVFTLSSVGDKLVVGTAGRHVQIYDLRNMDTPLQTRESSLRYQTRSIRCFPNAKGFALSSIEGRVAIEYFEEEDQVKKYAFKCHRMTQGGMDVVYPVNAIAFHHKYGTFATGGSDGVVNVWDAENRKRLQQYPKYPTSISSLCFSEDGNFLAVASSYTFEEGEKTAPADQLFIRTIADGEVKPRAKTDVKA